MSEAPARSAPVLWVATPRLGAPSERWLMRQVEGLDRHRPVVLTWEDQRDERCDGIEVRQMHPPLPARLTETGMARWLARARRVPGRNFYAASRAEVRALARLAAADRPAAILAQYGQTGLRMAPVARAAGVPLVVHFHGHDLSYSLDNRWYRWSLRRALPQFDRIVVVAGHQRDRLKRFGVPAARISVVPCGVPVARFTPPQDRPAGPPRFLVVSRLVPSKGVDVALSAFAALLRDMPEARLTIVGDGPERARLETQAAPLGAAVTFTGAVSPGEVRDRMAAASVYVQHSLGRPGHPLGSEGSPVAIAEAQAMALPVIVSVCGGVDELVIDGETGFVVAQRDVPAVTTAMARLAADPARAAAMGAAGRRHVSAEFDAARQIARLETVLAAAADDAG